MNWVDGGVLLFLAMAAAAGWRFGVIPGALLFAGALGGMHWSNTHAQAFGEHFTQNKHAWVLGYAFYTIGGAGAGWLAGLLLRRLMRTLPLGWLDRIGGAAFSAGACLVGLSIVLVVLGASTHTPRWVATAVHHSPLATRIVNQASDIRAAIPEELGSSRNPSSSREKANIR